MMKCVLIADAEVWETYKNFLLNTKNESRG